MSEEKALSKTEAEVLQKLPDKFTAAYASQAAMIKHFGGLTEAFEMLALITLSSKDAKTKLSALNKLLEYAYGKPQTNVDVTTDGEKIALPEISWINSSPDNTQQVNEEDGD